MSLMCAKVGATERPTWEDDMTVAQRWTAWAYFAVGAVFLVGLVLEGWFPRLVALLIVLTSGLLLTLDLLAFLMRQEEAKIQKILDEEASSPRDLDTYL